MSTVHHLVRADLLEDAIQSIEDYGRGVDYCNHDRKVADRLRVALAAPAQQPAPGTAAQALAGEIVAALLADEKDEGYDLTAGLFGPAFSKLVRRWAAAEFNAPAQQPAWQPIGSAPKDNARPLYLARFNEAEKLAEIDFDGGWDFWQESYELPHVNGWDWVSANGIENPTHWAYQDGCPPGSVPSAPAPIETRRVSTVQDGPFDSPATWGLDSNTDMQAFLADENIYKRVVHKIDVPPVVIGGDSNA